MRRLVIVAAVASLAACGSRDPLSHSYETPEALAAAVLDGFRAQDGATLQRLALTEEEFRERVWPELPSARPERNLPFSYVWGDLRQKSEASLRTLLARHGGQPYTLVSVSFNDRTPYRTFTVHRESAFAVLNDGEQQVRLCGSMIEQGGLWKVFSYVVDN